MGFARNLYHGKGTMNRHTQCDLSFNEVKLDYSAMMRVSIIALSEMIDEANKTLSDMRTYPIDATRLHMSGEDMAIIGEKLAVISDVVAALEEGKTRENVIIVNK